MCACRGRLSSLLAFQGTGGWGHGADTCPLFTMCVHCARGAGRPGGALGVAGGAPGAGREPDPTQSLAGEVHLGVTAQGPPPGAGSAAHRRRSSVRLQSCDGTCCRRQKSKTVMNVAAPSAVLPDAGCPRGAGRPPRCCEAPKVLGAPRGTGAQRFSESEPALSAPQTSGDLGVRSRGRRRAWAPLRVRLPRPGSERPCVSSRAKSSRL